MKLSAKANIYLGVILILVWLVTKGVNFSANEQTRYIISTVGNACLVVGAVTLYKGFVLGGKKNDLNK